MADIEQDVERIRSALFGQAPHAADLVDVATRYAASCGEVNDRLQRCQGLLRKGLRGESLQLAQHQPPVLDQFALIDFPERGDWCSFAKEQGLPLPPQLQAGFATELNSAFAEAETLKECIRRHRLLALARAHLRRRVQVMWRLAKLDPLNPIWTKDLRDFEQARLGDVEREIHQAVRHKDIVQLQDLIKELSAPAWSEPSAASLLHRAKAVRNHLLARDAQERLVAIEAALSQAVAEGDKAAAEAVYDEALPLRQLAALPADNPLQRRLELASRWVEEGQANDRVLLEWQTACQRMTKAMKARVSPARLDAMLRAVHSFGMGLPEELEHLVRRARRGHSVRRVLKTLFYGILLVGLLGGGYAVVKWREKASTHPVSPTLRPKVAPDREALRTKTLEDPAQAFSVFVSERCDGCHAKRKNSRIPRFADNLVLLSEKAARDPLGQQYLVPGKPVESAIWLRVEDGTMPQDKELSSREKDQLKSWILKLEPAAVKAIVP